MFLYPILNFQQLQFIFVTQDISSVADVTALLVHTQGCPIYSSRGVLATLWRIYFRLMFSKEVAANLSFTQPRSYYCCLVLLVWKDEKESTM